MDNVEVTECIVSVSFNGNEFNEDGSPQRRYGRYAHRFVDCARGDTRLYKITSWRTKGKVFVVSLNNPENMIELESCSDCDLRHNYPRPDFEEHGACFDGGSELFFQTVGNRHTISEVRDKYCDNCNIRTECGEYAAVHRFDYGFWGGLSKEQRAKIRKRIHEDNRLR